MTGKWHDIATAPDKTAVLIAATVFGTRQISVCWKHNGMWSGGPAAIHSWKPTHWMDLPEFPTEPERATPSEEPHRRHRENARRRRQTEQTAERRRV